jgi:hypothetical protein
VFGLKADWPWCRNGQRSATPIRRHAKTIHRKTINYLFRRLTKLRAQMPPVA